MKNFVICYNKTISDSIKVKEKLSLILQKNDNCVFETDINNLKYINNTEFVFVIGGDGTILKAARFFAAYKIPVFGINLGRLGFLSQSSKEELENAVNKILENKFITEQRIMLKSTNHTALNDFVVKGSDCGRTSKFSLKINGKFVCDYLADGIIISTPTGSTAYGLSAGGPVLTPSLNAFVIVPICPHTLTARPIVVPDTEKITIYTDTKSKYLVSVDGQEFYESDMPINIEKSNNFANLALLEDSGFYSILRNKLHWATHPNFRN